MVPRSCLHMESAATSLIWPFNLSSSANSTISFDKLKQEIKVIQAKKVVPDPPDKHGTGAEIESGGGIEEG